MAFLALPQDMQQKVLSWHTLCITIVIHSSINASNGLSLPTDVSDEYLQYLALIASLAAASNHAYAHQ